MMEVEADYYNFAASIDLDDLIDSVIEDQCNPDTCPSAKRWNDDLTSLLSKTKTVERGQKEINKMFSACHLQLDRFKENLEEAEEEEKEKQKVLQKAKEDSGNAPSEVIIESSSDEEDVQFIEKTFNPDIAAKHQGMSNGSRPSDVNNKPKGDLTSQTARDKLTEALSNAGAAPPRGMRKFLTDSMERHTYVVTIPKISYRGRDTRNADSRTSSLNNSPKLSYFPQPTSSLIQQQQEKSSSSPATSLSLVFSSATAAPLVKAPAPKPPVIPTNSGAAGQAYPPGIAPGTSPATLTALQKKVAAGNTWPNYSTSIANQEKMEELYLVDVKSDPVFAPGNAPGTSPATLNALQKKVAAGNTWPNYSTPIANQEKMEELYLVDVNKIKCGSTVLYKKFQDLWDKGVLNEILYPYKEVYERKYKVKCDSKKTLKTLTAKQIAFGWPLNKPVTVGTRIVALYKEDDSEGAFYAGIVAEAPNGRNGLRYLIFFDDGYAQYCTAKEIYKVFYQSKPVWEDIDPDTKDFVRDYLAQYPERPMVRLHKGQSVKTEWNGKWWNARVEEVDASLVSMYFSADQRNEWIYRGSTRLEPLYTALANAEANRNAGKVKRHNVANAGPKKPVVEYTRNNSSDSPAKPDKKKAVAKKSTTPQNTLDTGKIWEAPWMKKKPGDAKPSVPGSTDKATASTIVPKPTKDKDIASVLQERLIPTEDSGTVELEALGTRLDQVVPLNDRKKTKFVSHRCNPKCVLESGTDPEKFRGYNPLLIPLHMNWERHVSKLKPSGRRMIFYTAPCGRRLRSLNELGNYLELTNCCLAIDNFCYDTELHVNYEFIPVKTFCDIKDISYGKENVTISCVNGIDRQYPDYVEYSNQRIPASGVKLNLEPDFLVGCDCKDNCRDKSKCACQQLTVEASAITNGGKPYPEAGYKHRRLLDPLISGVYECNSRCGCAKTCVNRVVQNGLHNRLQVFKTEKRGWGLRCLDDIPKGGFICIYAGQLLTDQGANEDGQQYGDEYLAELDYMEVVESHKEGYESDVEDIDDITNNDDVEDEFDSNDDMMGSDSDDSYSKQRKKKEKVAEKSHQTRRSSRRTGNNEESQETTNKSSDSKSNNRTTEGRGPKQTAQKSTTMLPRNGISGNKDSTDVRDTLSSPNSSTELTEGDHKKKRTGRSTAARYGSMVPTKNKDKVSDEMETEETKFLPTRHYFRDDQSCYIMDAKSMGNIGRYLNHSCQPVAFVQNVFVDTHDLRFPWIAFFAGQYISAGTELTWDYNYEVGSVPGKWFRGFGRAVYIGNSDTHSGRTRLDEPSGIGASRIHRNILYAHDDENDEVAVYAIDARTGRVVARFNIRHATNVDWEDMSVGPCGHHDDRSCMYILDDGVDSSEHIHGQPTIYKIVEPSRIQNTSLNIEAKLEFRWPGKTSDTLMVDPHGEVYIIYTGSGHRVKMARLPYSAWNSATPVYIDSDVYFGVVPPAPHSGPDGGDISPDGREIVVINDDIILHFTVNNGDYLTALSDHHPTRYTRLLGKGTSMGVCWSADGRSIYVIDELSDDLYKIDKL